MTGTVKITAVVCLILGVFSTLSTFAHPIDERYVFVKYNVRDNEFICEVEIPEKYLALSEIDISSDESIIEGLEPCLAEDCPVTINGIRRLPKITSLKNITPPDLDVETIYRAEIRYTTEEPVKTVTVVWSILPVFFELPDDSFMPDISALFFARGDYNTIEFTEENLEFEWSDREKDSNADDAWVDNRITFLKPEKTAIPILSIIFAVITVFLLIPAVRGNKRMIIPIIFLILSAYFSRSVWRVEIGPETSIRIEIPENRQIGKMFKSLNENIYRAFNYFEEEKIYDVIARSIDGVLLDSIYQNIHKSLVLQDDGDAVCRIENVEIKQFRITGSGVDKNGKAYININCDWEVTGIVRHWGHGHQRINRYKADFIITSCDGFWKITAIQINDQTRITEDLKKDE